MKTQEKNHAKEQAKAQLESIAEMVKALEKCRKAEAEGKDDYDQLEQAEQAIQEDPLSIEVREDWHSPMDKGETTEFNILLCTGGPAVRMIGTLDSNLSPFSARLEYQDWGTPWTEFRVNENDQQILLIYARCFFYGE